ncbi:MAG TPA: response regulator transcription factor [Streptosporangiaceae bacterium]|nr:response regulator transcription factor [Streptosporangiaceae bacterium]
MPMGDGQIRVLVVDDHPIWRNAAARDLAEAGFSVVGTAGDGAQALRVAAATRPKVVLLDLHLPDLPGAEVIRGLLAADAGIRVLMLSASGERQDVLDAVTAGACGYLLKSAQLSELIAGVRATAAGQAVFTPGLAGLVLGEYRRLARDGSPAAGAGPARPAPGVAGAGPGRPGAGGDRRPRQGIAGRGAIPGHGAGDDGAGGVGGGLGADIWRTQPVLAPVLTNREAEILRLVAKGLTYPQIATRLTLSTRTVQNHVQNTLSKLQLHNKAQLVRYALEQGVD